MKAVAGVFISLSDARLALPKLQSIGMSWERLVLLTPDEDGSPAHPFIPAFQMGQPGIAQVLGGAVDAALGAAGGSELGAVVVTTSIPGVGPVFAIGLLSTAVLGLAGAEMDSAAKEGLAADEMFVYEDALRKGRSVVLAFAADGNADSVRQILGTEGAESIDAARQRWWVSLRSAEKEQYSNAGNNFDEDEYFYRQGFEAALRAKSRYAEYDKIASEMDSEINKLRLRYPNSDKEEEAFENGYVRGCVYHESICNKAKAA